MFEVEAKVRLSNSDYKRLKKEVPKIANFKKRVNNIDCYYSSNKNFALRIRQQEKKSILHFKNKKIEQGTEVNQEIEFNLKNAEKMKTFLKKIGINLPLKKEKQSEIFKMGNMQIELNFVKKLGYFLEIETLVKAKSQIPKAKKSLLEAFRKLGFKSSDFEKKYYLELLNEQTQ